MAIQKIEIGDCRKVIGKYPDNFFSCLVTSPPYYRMREYHTAPLIYGGKKDCDHQWKEIHDKGHSGRGNVQKNEKYSEQDDIEDFDYTYSICQCGAFKGELGWEPTPEVFVRDLIEVFETIRPKIKETGSIWVNLGDKWIDLDQQLIPEQFALGMKKKGWILINKVTWFKPNSMPGSQKRRLTKTSELIFHFVKSPDYWYDLDAIRVPHKTQSLERYQRAVDLGVFAETSKYGDRQLMGMPQHTPKWFVEGANTGVNNKEPYKDNNPHRTRLYEGKFNGMGKGSEQFGSPRARNERLEKKEIGGLGYGGLVERDRNRELRDIDAYIGKNPGDFISIGIDDLTKEEIKFELLNMQYQWRRLHPEDWNLNDVFIINTQSYRESHFATFPYKLLEILILSTCPLYICKKCGKPRERITQSITLDRTATDGCGNGELSDGNFGSSVHKQVGWSDCKCGVGFEAGWTIDPFVGSGTTLEFCRDNNRNAIGIDLNPNYKNLAVKRARLNEPPVKPISITEVL